MAKILVSWLDDRYDFNTQGSTAVNKQGINYQIHLFYFEKEAYDMHLLLYHKDSNLAQVQSFTDCVGRDFKKPHKIEAVQVLIKDPINLKEIHAKTQAELFKHSDDQIDIFFNPGYQMMQISFYICHTTLNLNTRLIQLRQAKFTQEGKPGLEEITTESSKEGYALMVQQNVVKPKGKQSGNIGEDVKVTRVLEPVYKRAKKVAEVTGIPVLINGESGTGKEWLAKYIAENDPASSAYYKINCAAFTDELLLSELMGHVKGAFTGATNDKTGFFEKANNGILFLDEIGDISKFTQVALLRVLQEGVINKVGSTEPIKIKTRVIAATNRDLIKKVQDGSFRQDLYYRLAKTKLVLPSWKEYPQKDKSVLIEYMLEKVARITRRNTILDLQKNALDFLYEYPLLGNLRQLENIISTLYVFYHDEKIDSQILEKELNDELMYLEEKSTSLLLSDVEKMHIKKVLRIHKNNLTKTFKALGFGSVNTLKKKMKDYEIDY